ncbi:MULTISPECIES: hypothetical protein [Streptomyces]|uniref:hypothetical protein n=1 Tax=Streptomyces TaxID=1883 RepID=UPI0004D89E9E|nr:MULTISPECIES: hypothetical protein [Streptomyces]OFA52493.1 hypothetical protein BEN35_11165 [Streptomyces fradiae]
MSDFLFPDNTVLCNFAAVERLDLLRAVLDGRGKWTAAVSREAKKSAERLPALRDLRQQGWLGKAIRVTTPDDHANVEHLRTAVFGGPAERHLQNLGEAETCHIIQHWPQFSGAWWLSDDKSALEYAIGQGIMTAETLDMMQLAVKAGFITAEDAFTLMQKMRQLNRYPRLPRSVADLTVLPWSIAELLPGQSDDKATPYTT